MIVKSVRKLSYQTSACYADVPALHLAGRYLTQKYGWQVGDRVRVDYQADKIIIKKEEL